jgi:hypothetical protein
MYVIIHDRVFWIYFIVTLFFIILGMGYILTSNDSQMIVISILWLLSNVALMIVVYHASINWGPVDPNNNTQICVVDPNSGCFEPDNRVWLFINIIFIALLILSVLWAGELRNDEGSPLRTMSGILILLGGLLLCELANGYKFVSNIYTNLYEFWLAVAYILIWFGLTLYIVITT